MLKNLKHMRIILISVAIAIVLIPIMIVGITGNGLGEVVSHTLISLSIALLVGATLLGINRQDKTFFFKVGVSIGLLIVLLSVWI